MELSWEVTNLSRKNSWVGWGGVKLFPLLLLLILELGETSTGYCSAAVESGFKFSASTGFSSLAFSLLLSELGSLSCPFSASTSGLWVLGSMPFCLSFFLMQEFHKFFISLSVLPGNWAAICDHLMKQQKTSESNRKTTILKVGSCRRLLTGFKVPVA